MRFNIGDPIQLAAVELLELQPPHGKAQYIANALAYYNAHFADNPQPLKVPAIDRASIEAIVREVMQKEERCLDQPDSTASVCQTADITAPVPRERAPESEYEPELGEKPEIDHMTRDLISSTMAAFRRNG